MNKLCRVCFYTLYKLYIWNVRKPPKFHATQTQPSGGESSHSSNATRKENNLWKKIFIFGKPLSPPHPIFPFIECVVYRDLCGILRTSLSHFTLCIFTIEWFFEHDILVMFHILHLNKLYRQKNKSSLDKVPIWTHTRGKFSHSFRLIRRSLYYFFRYGEGHPEKSFVRELSSKLAFPEKKGNG